MSSSTVLKKFLQRDRVVRAMTKDGHFRLAAVNLSHTVQTAQQRHNLGALATVFLGRLMAGATLMASFLKGEERIILEAMGHGPLQKLYAEAMQVGEIRGYAAEPQATLDFSDASVSLGDALGVGLFRVTKILYNRFEPIVGVVELTKGDISTDLAYYLTQSEQIPSAVILDVQVDDAGQATQCGGVMVQALPGAPEEAIRQMQESLLAATSVADLIKVGYIPEEMLRMIVPAEIEELGHARVDFFCRCSLENFTSVLRTLGVDELTSMREMGQNELVCRYCNEHHIVPEEELDAIIQELRAQSN